MGIPVPLIEFFLQEHRYRPWKGKLLTLGKQTVLVTPEQLKGLLERNGIRWDASKAQIDRKTVQAQQETERQYVDDATLFSSFCSVILHTLDVTSYEGADIIHDLCKPIPAHLSGQYDIIFNGSVLDNIFDPAEALRNTTRMLSPRGRIIHIEMASNLAFEYLIYSTDWFIDYYVVNEFADCRIYVCTFDTTEQLLYGPWSVYAYVPKPDGTAFSLRSLPYKQAVIVVIAEKRPSSTSDEVPVQWVYRDEKMKAAYNEKLAAFSSERPIFGFKHGQRHSSVIQPGGFLEV